RARGVGAAGLALEGRPRPRPPPPRPDECPCFVPVDPLDRRDGDGLHLRRLPAAAGAPAAPPADRHRPLPPRRLPRPPRDQRLRRPGPVVAAADPALLDLLVPRLHQVPAIAAVPLDDARPGDPGPRLPRGPRARAGGPGAGHAGPGAL